MHLTAVLGFPIPHLHVAPDVHSIYESIQTHETNIVPVYLELRRKYFAVGVAYVECLQESGLIQPHRGEIYMHQIAQVKFNLKKY
jgi:hypothetical protein